ncbi:MAG: pGP6-D family virulence protein [Chlamydiales bacterium]
MSSVNNLLNQRLKGAKKTSKITALAKESAEGSRTGFTGIFRIAQLSEQEKGMIQDILITYAKDGVEVEQDREQLLTLSAEVKAINNQAALLHGERIKKAHDILLRYTEGAFTAWLLATYGNRQTPYNFMYYYNFYTALPEELKQRIELMPRQAIYTLASRDGDNKIKHEIIAKYDGETKGELLEIIREHFPLDETDKRKSNQAEKILSELQRISGSIARNKPRFSKKQKQLYADLLETLTDLILS